MPGRAAKNKTVVVEEEINEEEVDDSGLLDSSSPTTGPLSTNQTQKKIVKVCFQKQTLFLIIIIVM